MDVQKFFPHKIVIKLKKSSYILNSSLTMACFLACEGASVVFSPLHITKDSLNICFIKWTKCCILLMTQYSGHRSLLLRTLGGFFPAFHTHNVAVSIFLRSFFFFGMCAYAYLCLFFIEKFL